MGTGFLSRIKRPELGLNHQPQRVELYLYSPLWDFVACCRVNTFTFTYYFRTQSRHLDMGHKHNAILSGVQIIAM